MSGSQSGKEKENMIAIGNIMADNPTAAPGNVNQSGSGCIAIAINDDNNTLNNFAAQAKRRVSFASTAHVRLFDKDQDQADLDQIQKQLLLGIEQKRLKKETLGLFGRDDIGSPGPAGSNSPMGANGSLLFAPDTPDRFSCIENENENENTASSKDLFEAKQTSFEINVTGSPNSLSTKTKLLPTGLGLPQNLTSHVPPGTPTTSFLFSSAPNTPGTGTKVPTSSGKQFSLLSMASSPNASPMNFIESLKSARSLAANSLAKSPHANKESDSTRSTPLKSIFSFGLLCPASSTPVSVSAKSGPSTPFGKSRLQQSATPLLDRAIGIARELETPLNGENAFEPTHPLATTLKMDTSIAVEMEMSISYSSRDTSMALDKSVAFSTNDEQDTKALDSTAVLAANTILPDSSILQIEAEDSNPMDIDQGSAVNAPNMEEFLNPSANATGDSNLLSMAMSITPRQQSYLAKYPTFGSARTSTPQSSVPRPKTVVSSARKSALDSPLIREGIERLASGPYRGSIAPFFRASPRLEEKQVKSAVKEIPSARRNMARDSIAPFFKSTRSGGFARESLGDGLANESFESIGQAEQESPRKARVGRDSIAGFFTRHEEDKGSEDLEKLEESEQQIKKKRFRARDSVAGFFPKRDEEEEDTTQSEINSESEPVIEESFNLDDQGQNLTDGKPENPFWQAGENAEGNVAANTEAPNESLELFEGEVSQALMSSTPLKPAMMLDQSVLVAGLSPVAAESNSASPKALLEEEKESANTGASPKRRSSRSGSATKSASAKKAKTVHTSPLTRSQARKALQESAKKPSSNAVTPMRRAVANRSIINALNSPKVVEVQSMKSSPTSSRKNKRKSVGGNLLKALENERKDIEPAFLQAEDSQVIATGGMDSATVEVEAVAPAAEIAEDEDLMDEQHLSIMDTSAVVEAEDNLESRPPILSLSDFKTATGLDFTFEGVLEAEIAPESKTGPAILAAIDILESEHYNQGCNELVKIIADLEDETASYENMISRNTPLLFDEFSQGSSRDRDEILSQLKLAKELCFDQARIEWYSWKGLTLDHLHGRLQEDFEQLSAHHESFKSLLEEFIEMDLEAKAYYNDLAKMVPLARVEVNAKMNHIQETSTRLVDEKTAKKNEIALIKQQIQDLKLKTAQLQEETIKAEKRDSELRSKIENAKKTCAELVVFDPADLSVYRGEYSLLISTHSWRPSLLSVGKQTWVFDESIQVSFSNQGDSYLMSTLIYEGGNQNAAKPMINFSANTCGISAKVMQEIGKNRISTLLRTIDKSQPSIKTCADMKRAMLEMASSWESVKALYRDIRKARHFTSAAIVLAPMKPNCPLFSIKTKFFNSVKRLHIVTDFVFSVENGIFLYPNGRWDISFSVTYGDVPISDLRESILSLDNGADLLARLCKHISESL